jgi:hypothetical protein
MMPRARSCGVVPHSEPSRPVLMLLQFCQTTGGSTQLGRFEGDFAALHRRSCTPTNKSPQKKCPLCACIGPIPVSVARPGVRPEKGNTVMNTTHNTKTRRLIAALGVSAAAAVTPALLFAGAGTAHADDPCSGDLAYSYYCSPASGGQSQAPEPMSPFSGPPSTNLWPSLPGCTGGVLEALDGEC